jgi:hypothetical protein
MGGVRSLRRAQRTLKSQLEGGFAAWHVGMAVARAAVWSQLPPISSSNAPLVFTAYWFRARSLPMAATMLFSHDCRPVTD